MFKINIFTTKNGHKILYIKDINNFINIDCNEYEDGIYDISKEQLLDVVNKYSYENFNKIKKIIDTKDRNLLSLENKIEYPHYSLCLHPSRECNLNCKYCFADDCEYLPKNGLTIELAKKAIDFLVYDIGKNGSAYSIDLSGSGEPLLKFDFIKEIEEYCDEIRSNTGKDIKIMFPTNATLLNQEKINYFESKPNILLGISIDGDDKYNINRVYKDGTPIYNDIKNNIKMLKRTYGLSVTICHENEHVDEVFDHLYNEFKYVDSITMHLVRDFNLDSPTCLYKVNKNNLIEHYKLLIKNMHEHIIKDDYNYVFALLRGIDTLGTFIVRVLTKGKLSRFRCGGAKNRFAMDDKGNLFACSIVSGNDDFKVGDIFNGIDKRMQRKHLKINAEANECKDCWCSYVCSGECPVVGYLTSGNMYKPDLFSCNIKKELIKLSIEFVDDLYNNNLKAYKKLVRFANLKFNDLRTDSGIWAINQYLRSKNITIDYSDLCNKINKEDKGIRPNEVLRIIKEYVASFEAYKVIENQNLEEIKYPAILCDYRGLNYNYYIIESTSEDVVNIKTLEKIELTTVPFNYIKENSLILMAELL